MNEYEAKQEEKRERLREAAAKRRAESNRRGNEALRMGGIMQGEPIKIGHHSEKRHRRYADRMDNNMRKASELSKEADELERRADAVGAGGVSEHDPDAVLKLREKLEEMKALREEKKKRNAIFRKYKRKAKPGEMRTREREAVDLAEAAGEITATTANAWRMVILSPPYPSWPFIPSEGYELSNLGANIRRVEKRVAELEAGPPTFEPLTGEGWGFVDGGDQRIWLTFERRTSRDVYQQLRCFGWKWSRTRGAFVRNLNANGIGSAKHAHAWLGHQVGEIWQ